ncbi:hypothetical protein [Thermoplasma acidophilum]|uniref:Uncharacterized protein n=1 Tax=Thermoplasma acidophilum (strain ATCC 25905 / DSM 1728 / JCM 9062 / NBRC 15155 / AMRC-C165) TaxID=273075 RepID=Q9HK88_THEAC|nr:hypothetical protein [Thermoplasma acidophilum]
MLTLHIGGIGIGEPLWFICNILVSFIFSYKLFNSILHNNNISYIFALIYTFSPAMAVLTYSTSWETVLSYAFSPLILYLLYLTFNNLELKGLSFDLILISIFMYVYYFDTDVIMWEGILVVSMLIYLTISHTNRKNCS